MDGSGAWNKNETGLYTIFDTGAPDIMISELWFDSFMEELFAIANKTYTIENGRAQYANE